MLQTLCNLLYYVGIMLKATAFLTTPKLPTISCILSLRHQYSWYITAVPYFQSFLSLLMIYLVLLYISTSTIIQISYIRAIACQFGVYSV